MVSPFSPSSTHPPSPFRFSSLPGSFLRELNLDIRVVCAPVRRRCEMEAQGRFIVDAGIKGMRCKPSISWNDSVKIRSTPQIELRHLLHLGSVEINPLCFSLLFMVERDIRALKISISFSLFFFILFYFLLFINLGLLVKIAERFSGCYPGAQ